ncbi:MAG: Do family serine endopeptidase [Gammaproteobacteria bacterium]
MRISRLVTFFFQAVTIGLAAAFVIVYLYPELLHRRAPVVEFHEHAGAPNASARPPTVSPGPVSYAPAVNIAAPAVVNIYTQKLVTERSHPFLDDPLLRRFFGDQGGGGKPHKRLETSLGSGVIVSPQGYILTNNHVIDGADEIEVALHDGRTASAKVVGTDPETDLAVLRIELDKLPVITLGSADKLQVGDVVLAIGNPYGVGQTVTAGIVSATGRTQLGINTYENFIQTDAAINPGNSGGALINPSGELVGVNTAIFSRTGGSQGIGFAIPVSLARDVMAQIIEHGHVVRGWLGVEIQDINDALAESFGVKSSEGVLIAGVLDDGPADRAGLKRGDIITAIQHQPVKDVHDALAAIAKAHPGSAIRVDGIRGGKPFHLEATVSERPKQPERTRRDDGPEGGPNDER